MNKPQNINSLINNKPNLKFKVQDNNQEREAILKTSDLITQSNKT